MAPARARAPRPCTRCSARARRRTRCMRRWWSGWAGSRRPRRLPLRRGGGRERRRVPVRRAGGRRGGAAWSRARRASWRTRCWRGWRRRPRAPRSTTRWSSCGDRLAARYVHVVRTGCRRCARTPSWPRSPATSPRRPALHPAPATGWRAGRTTRAAGARWRACWASIRASPAGGWRWPSTTSWRRLRAHREQFLPGFRRYQELRQRDRRASGDALRLSEFKARPLTSFVRNRLIDEVYLPLIGDNLAKQIGAAGEGKRTDLMGLLLLISPPGYGKTTLMEYVARPAGPGLREDQRPGARPRGDARSIPAQAPNATARQELEKLNLGAGDGQQRDAVRGRHPAHAPRVPAEVHLAVRRHAAHRGRVARRARRPTTCAASASPW